MGGRLIAHTVVPGEPGSGVAHVVLGPDDEVPDWAAKQIGAHLFEGGVHPLSGDELAERQAAEAAGDAIVVPVDDGGQSVAEQTAPGGAAAEESDLQGVAEDMAADAAGDAVVVPPEEDGDVQPPPKGGAGSGVEAWRAYAKRRRVPVADDANRDEVVAALQAAGHPVE